MKAVFLDFLTMGPGLDVSELEASLPDLTIFDNTSATQLADRLARAEVVLGNKIRITAEVMRDHPNIRYVGLTATGTDNIDLEAAKRHEIAVCNIRAYCTESIAEHVFSSLLYLTRNLGQFRSAVRNGQWQQSDIFCLQTFPMRELSAMTLGIVGYGELGRGVQKVAEAFGMKVILSARPGTEVIPEGRVSFDDLLQQADVISLHCPLTADTTNLFSTREFRMMKSDAILINTARGGLVDSAALSSALSKGDIAAAAVDVLPQEPPVDGDPLLDYDGPNLLVTPHIAWATKEARQAALDQLTACINAFKSGKKLNRVV